VSDDGRLPFEPEPIASMRARYAAARKTLYVQEDVAAGLVAPPSGFRAHVFDFEDGLRLIISRDRDPTGLVVIHLSASVVDDTPMYQHVCNGRIGMSEFFERVKIEWQTLSGSTLTPQLIGVSDKYVPHWIVPEAH
jgi:hypothetical protein